MAIQAQTDKRDIQVALAQVQAGIMSNEDQLETLREDHGKALSEMRTGDKTASKKAASLSLKIGEIERHTASLESEKRALSARMAQVVEAEHIANITGGQTRVAEVATELDALTNTYADAITEAYELVHKIEALHVENQRLRVALGVDYPTEGAPVIREPRRLLNVTGPDETGKVDRWLNPVKAGIYTLPGTVQGNQPRSTGEQYTVSLVGGKWKVA